MKKIIGKKLVNYSKLDSTNKEARRLIKKGEGEGLAILADMQTGGKGKPGRVWFSPAGTGVYLSIVVKPYKNPEDLVPLTLLSAHAVIDAINKTCGLTAKVKLPNDVLIKNIKVCGILCERVPSGHVIIGIGVNINNKRSDFPPGLNATSLKIESGREINKDNFVAELLDCLNERYLAYLK